MTTKSTKFNCSRSHDLNYQEKIKVNLTHCLKVNLIYPCQSCEEKNLQMAYAPSEWGFKTFDMYNIEYNCDNKHCKWFKSL